LLCAWRRSVWGGAPPAPPPVQQKVLDTINKKSNLASDPPTHPPTPLNSAIWTLKIAYMILYNYISIIEPLWALMLLLWCCTKC
jgi:hypothetical protein